MSPLDLQLPEPTYLIQMPNGKPTRVSSYLFQILSLMNGERSISQIALAVSHMQKRRISEKEIIWIMEEKLKKLDLLEPKKDSAPSFRTPIEVSSGRKHITIAPDKLRIVTELLQNLFTWPAVIILLPLIVVVNVWALQQYGFLILRVCFAEMTGIDYLWTLILICGCLAFHEIGHLAACRHYGCVHGEMGVKVSIVVPTFFADVTDAWRLTRSKRAIVDLGGLWFQLLCIPLLYCLYAVTVSLVPIFGIFLLNLGVLWVMIPTPKSDGYWFLSDLLGLPSLNKEDYWRLLTTDSQARRKILATASLILLLGLFTLPVTLEAISIWLTMANNSLMAIMRSFTRASVLDLLDGLVRLVVLTAIVTGLFLLNLRLVRCAKRARIIGWLRSLAARN